MNYVAPCDAPISADYDNHKYERRPASREPGTDYACAYGTRLRAPASGRIANIDNNPGGAEGRRWSMIADDGGQIDMIHLSRVGGKVGDRVEKGQLLNVYSGASGFGKDWYYGPHVHVTYRPKAWIAYTEAADFEKKLARPTTGNKPVTPSPVHQEMEEDLMDMLYVYDRAKDVGYAIHPVTGKKRVVPSAEWDAVRNAGLPVAESTTAKLEKVPNM